MIISKIFVKTLHENIKKLTAFTPFGKLRDRIVNYPSTGSGSGERKVSELVELSENGFSELAPSTGSGTGERKGSELVELSENGFSELAPSASSGTG